MSGIQDMMNGNGFADSSENPNKDVAGSPAAPAAVAEPNNSDNADAAKAEVERLAADAAAKSNADAFDWNTALKDKYKGIDELTAIEAKAKQADDMLPELTDLRAAKIAYEEMKSLMPDLDDFDETQMRLAFLTKKEPEKAKFFNKMLNEQNPLEKLREALKYSNKKYADNPDLLNAKLKKDYAPLFGDIPDKEMDLEAYNEYLLAKSELEDRAEDEAKKIVVELDAIKVPKKLTETDKTAQAEANKAKFEKHFTEVVKPVVDKAIADLKVIRFDTIGEDGKTIEPIELTDFPEISADKKLEAALQLANSYVAHGVDMTKPENQKEYAEGLNTLIFNANKKEIMTAFKRQILKEIKAEIDNPGSTKQAAVSGHQKDKSKDDVITDGFMGVLGMK